MQGVQGGVPNAGSQPAFIEPERRAHDELTAIATDSLRPAGLVIHVLFLLFALYHGCAFWRELGPIVVSCDLALSAVGAYIFYICRRRVLSVRTLHLAIAGMSLAAQGINLFTAWRGTNPMSTFYTAILLIATMGSVLAPWWAFFIMSIEVGAWTVFAARALPLGAFAMNSFVMVTSVAVAIIVHNGRYRSRCRIVELRTADFRREQALQSALEAADEARRSLDRRVDERTADLSAELATRRRLEAQLRHAHKLEAVGRLAGGIAHDFNNLLTVTRLSLGNAVEYDHLPTEVKDALQDATAATDRAASLTRDLLAFARKQTIERANIEVRDIVEAIDRMIRRVAPAGIHIDIDVLPNACSIVADRHQIEQVLLNLAINACDAMSDKGTLSLRADLETLADHEAERRGLTPGAYVRIRVTDTGVGMDDATLRTIFEPFFTTKEVGKGSGLGLSVAHGIIAQHSGFIEVTSTPGMGSTFTVYLPSARLGATASHSPGLEEARALGQETLLVVEDESAVRAVVQRNLRRLGYHVVVASNGIEALKIADDFRSVDLLLSDVVMPEMDGPELAARMRSFGRDIPVLFVTGYSADRLARSDALGPFDQVMEKPYRLKELASKIRDMLDARRERASVRSRLTHKAEHEAGALVGRSPTGRFLNV